MDEQLKNKITQLGLPEAMEKSLITQAEVEEIWRKTEHLSAQTPIEVRVALIKMIDAGYEVTPVEQMLMSTLLDLRAALYRDESKFSHLVAGTEEIVSKLQAINRWEALVERLSNKVDELTMMVDGMIVERHPPAPADTSDGEDDWPGPAPIELEAEAIVEEEYDRKIGSNWDPNNPRKK